jgi:hypothetical protein
VREIAKGKQRGGKGEKAKGGKEIPHELKASSISPFAPKDCLTFPNITLS